MATFPSKVNYVTGDVLTATNMNDIGGAINLLDGAQYSAGKNKIINGDFRINQRAFTSTTTSATYGFDRWRNTVSGGTVTYSAQTFTAGTAPVTGYEGINYARLVTVSQSASSDRAVLNQLVEDVRTLSGTTSTISFWAQAGSGTPKINVVLNQNFGTSGSASVNAPIPTAQTITTSWVRYSFTIAIPSVSGKTITSDSRLNVQIYVSDGGDQSTGVGAQNNTFNIWGVQLEEADTASPFQTATGTIQGELAACQRYYVRLGAASGLTTAAYATYGNGYTTSTTNATIPVQLPVTMRIAPTSVDYSGLGIINTSSTLIAVSAVAINSSNNSNNRAHVEATTTGATANVYQTLENNNSTSGYIGFSAEL